MLVLGNMFSGQIKDAASRPREADVIPAIAGRYLAGVGVRQPVMILRAELMPLSTSFVWELRLQTAAQDSAVLCIQEQEHLF